MVRVSTPPPPVPSLPSWAAVPPLVLDRGRLQLDRELFEAGGGFLCLPVMSAQCRAGLGTLVGVCWRWPWGLLSSRDDREAVHSGGKCT